PQLHCHLLRVLARALHSCSRLELEGGQRDCLSELLCWGAVPDALRGRAALPMFLATFATLLKGHAAPFALALFHVLEDRKKLRALAGGGAALLLLLLPVARYLPEALANVRVRLEQSPKTAWYNVSFRNLS